MTTKPLSERLRDNPTSDIMSEAADALDAQSEDYRELYAEKVALEQIVAAQAEAIAAKDAEIARLRIELGVLYRGYVNNLEAGRDRIIDLGGQCDPVEVMEASDPWLKDARAALAQEQS